MGVAQFDFPGTITHTPFVQASRGAYNDPKMGD